jgi:hypothetical protein
LSREIYHWQMLSLKQPWFQVWNVLLVTPLLHTHCCHHPEDHHTTHDLGCKCHVLQQPPPQHTHRVTIQYISKIVVISTWMLYSRIYTCRGHFLIQIFNLQTDSKTYNHIGPRILVFMKALQVSPPSHTCSLVSKFSYNCYVMVSISTLNHLHYCRWYASSCNWDQHLKWKEWFPKNNCATSA